jgi:hypothetical protein
LAQEKILIECGRPLSKISAIAFFGDVIHSILSVRAGVRVTLTYQLCRGGDVQEEEEEEEEEDMDRAEITDKPTGETEGKVGKNVSVSNPTEKEDAVEGEEEEGSESSSSFSSCADEQEAVRDYNSLRVQELKDLCRERGLAVSGKKIELINRLETATTPATPAAAVESTAALPVTYYDTKMATARAYSFATALRNCLLSNTLFTSDKTLLGFPCFHLYEFDELPHETLSNELKACNIKLRGADSIIAVTAARLGLTVEVVR